jgi:Zn-dependent protease
MASTITIGRVRGIPIGIHYSWFVAFLLFSFMLEQYFHQSHHSWSVEERLALALATSLMLFVSVVFHELAHSIVAVMRGMPVNGITLFIFGGFSHLDREARRPSTELIVAVAGPASSVLLGLVLLGIAEVLEAPSGRASAVVWFLGFANVFLLGLFNLVPAFPMDGGRVLRAAVWQVTRNHRRATVVASLGGQAVGLGMVGLGAALVVLDRSSLVSGIWLLVLGFFLQSLASAGRRQPAPPGKAEGYSSGGSVSG